MVQITYTITGLPHDALMELGANGPVFSRPFGSGFLVSNGGHVITAKHVLDEIENFEIDYREDGKHYVGVGLAYPNEEGEGIGLRATFRSITFDTVDCDERNDLALLRLSRNPFTMSERERSSSHGQILQPRVAVLDPARPQDGAPAAVAGFPLDQAALVTTAGHVACAWAADIKDRLIPDGASGYVATDIADRYLVDIQTNSGNSGGPAYLIETSAVMGVLINNVLTSVVGDNSLGVNANLGELVPARYVVELLLRNDLAPETHRVECAP